MYWHAALFVWAGLLCGVGEAQDADRTGDCICDMTSVACDPNCCCDVDCVNGDDSYIVNLAFTRCKKEKFGSRRGVLCTEPPVSLLEPYYINPQGSLEAVLNDEEEYYERKLATRNSETEKNAVCILHDNVDLDGMNPPLPPHQRIFCRHFATYVMTLTPTPLPAASPLWLSKNICFYRTNTTHIAQRKAHCILVSSHHLHHHHPTDGSYEPLATKLTTSELVEIERESDHRDIWQFQRDPPSERWATSGTGSTNIVPGYWYRVGDKVMAERGPETTDAAVPYLMLPENVDGVCSDRVPAFFMENTLESKPCTRVGDPETVCVEQLSIKKWQDLRISRPKPPGDTDTTPVAAVVTIYDENGNVATVQQTTQFQDGLCWYAVKRVAIEVTYRFLKPEQPQRYETASFTIALYLSAPAAVPFTQEHTIFWRPLSKTGTPEQRSGNPGYRRGYTIMGTTSEGGEVPEAEASPFALPLGMNCIDTTDVPVKFLHNVVASGCYVELTYVQFRTLCGEGQLFAQYAPTQVTARVAKYGNSQRSNADDWVTIDQRSVPPVGTSVINTEERTCIFHVGYDYTVVIRRMGKVYNPQVCAF